MKYTGNYNLKKPEGSDIVNIEDLNNNADIIDQALKAHDDALATKETPAGAQAKAEAAAGAVQAELDAHLADYASMQFGDRPYISLEDKTYYIDEVNGNDTNDGLTSATAFKTWEKCKSLIPYNLYHTYSIQFLSNYSNPIVLENLLCGEVGHLFIRSESQNANDVTISGTFRLINCYGSGPIQINVNYLTFTNAVQVLNCSLLMFDNCNFFNPSADPLSAGIIVGGGNYIRVRDCNFGDSIVQNAILTTYGCTVFSQNNTGNAIRVGLRALEGSVIVKYGNQPTGTVANEQTDSGGVIR